jgi:hypothetical protein
MLRKFQRHLHAAVNILETFPKRCKYSRLTSLERPEYSRHLHGAAEILKPPTEQLEYS